MSLPASSDKLDPSVPLTDERYERFARLRVMGVGCKEAAIEAGLPVTHRNAPRFDRHPEIIARKAYLAKDDAEVIAATRLMVRDRLVASVELNVLAHYAIIGHQEVGGKKVARVVGINWKALQKSDHSAAVTGFKFDRETGVMTEFTRDDPMQAMSQLRDMYGFRAPRRTELTGRAGGPVQMIDVTKLTHDQLVQLESILAAAAPAGDVEAGESGDPAAHGAAAEGSGENSSQPRLDLPANGR
ncbi:hypothetical protein [Bradyrhizobium genosp. L]|uniref:hypothetical protein n=1 Tax=Bradyrhizobium genosp. L TaxID=83637 RepID=UPI001FEE4099|nr:hypothetical protein [Bradyrhizobium genosp. L]